MQRAPGRKTLGTPLALSGAGLAVGLLVGGVGGTWGCATLLGVEEPRSMTETPDGGQDAPGAGITCTEPGRVVCGEACVDLLVDSDHCGACAHSCLGGSCQEGTCGAVALATGLVQPRDVSLSGDVLYFVSGSSGHDSFVARVHVTGPPCVGADDDCVLPLPSDLFHDTSQRWVATRIAANAKYAYVSFGGVGLARYRILDARWETLGALTSPVNELVATDDGLFVLRTGASYVLGMDSAAGSDLLGRATSQQGEVEALAGAVVPGWSAFVVGIEHPSGVSDASTSVGFHRFPLRPTAPICFDDACRLLPGHPKGVTAGGDWIYFGLADNVNDVERIARQHVDGACQGRTPCPEVIVPPFQHGGPLVPMVADARGLYWSQREANAPTHEVRFLEAGVSCMPGTPCGQRVLGSFDYVRRLVLDDKALYALVVHEDGEGQLLRIAR